MPVRGRGLAVPRQLQRPAEQWPGPRRSAGRRSGPVPAQCATGDPCPESEVQRHDEKRDEVRMKGSPDCDNRRRCGESRGDDRQYQPPIDGRQLVIHTGAKVSGGYRGLTCRVRMSRAETGAAHACQEEVGGRRNPRQRREAAPACHTPASVYADRSVTVLRLTSLSSTPCASSEVTWLPCRATATQHRDQVMRRKVTGRSSMVISAVGHESSSAPVTDASAPSDTRISARLFASTSSARSRSSRIVSIATRHLSHVGGSGQWPSCGRAALRRRPRESNHRCVACPTKSPVRTADRPNSKRWHLGPCRLAVDVLSLRVLNCCARPVSMYGRRAVERT
jgi:hypothetical protein